MVRAMAEPGPVRVGPAGPWGVVRIREDRADDLWRACGRYLRDGWWVKKALVGWQIGNPAQKPFHFQYKQISTKHLLMHLK